MTEMRGVMNTPYLVRSLIKCDVCHLESQLNTLATPQAPAP